MYINYVLYSIWKCNLSQMCLFMLIYLSPFNLLVSRCSPEYSGEYCQYPNPCDASRCMNDGRCVVIEGMDTFPEATCVCVLGYIGTLCEISHPDSACYNNPCEHGGRCSLLDSQDTYECECRLGYRGNYWVIDYLSKHNTFLYKA